MISDGCCGHVVKCVVGACGDRTKRASFHAFDNRPRRTSKYDKTTVDDASDLDQPIGVPSAVLYANDLWHASQLLHDIGRGQPG